MSNEGAPYIIGGFGMIVLGAISLIRGLEKPSQTEVFEATVLSTRAHKGGFKVLVGWRDRSGEEKQSYLIVSSGDLRTKQSTVHIMPSRTGESEFQLAKTTASIGPAIVTITTGVVAVLGGFALAT
jgi:hypothetical protein